MQLDFIKEMTFFSTLKPLNVYALKRQLAHKRNTLKWYSTVFSSHYNFQSSLYAKLFFIY